MNNEQVEQEECGICGLELNEKFSHSLKCNHTFHYECLMKSFQNIPKHKKEYNHCPYCRKKSVHLPLVNGLKKIVPTIHCNNNAADLWTLNLLLKNEYSNKCGHILTRGKNKGSECGKNCVLGYTNCKAHLK